MRFASGVCVCETTGWDASSRVSLVWGGPLTLHPFPLRYFTIPISIEHALPVIFTPCTRTIHRHSSRVPVFFPFLVFFCCLLASLATIRGPRRRLARTLVFCLTVYVCISQAMREIRSLIFSNTCLGMLCVGRMEILPFFF